MAQLSIEINGRPYIVGCEDGQEARLNELAAMVDSQVRQVGQDVGQLGETRLLLMGALMMADDLHDAKGRLSAAEGEAATLRVELGRAQSAAINALETAAQKIEAIATGGAGAA